MMETQSVSKMSALLSGPLTDILKKTEVNIAFQTKYTLKSSLYNHSHVVHCMCIKSKTCIFIIDAEFHC
jgi:hypothetical protein